MHELQDTLGEGTTMAIERNPSTGMLNNQLRGQWNIMPTTAAALLFESDGGWTAEEALRPKEV